MVSISFDSVGISNSRSGNFLKYVQHSVTRSITPRLYIAWLELCFVQNARKMFHSKCSQFFAIKSIVRKIHLLALAHAYTKPIFRHVLKRLQCVHSFRSNQIISHTAESLCSLAHFSPLHRNKMCSHSNYIKSSHITHLFAIFPIFCTAAITTLCVQYAVWPRNPKMRNCVFVAYLSVSLSFLRCHDVCLRFKMYRKMFHCFG